MTLLDLIRTPASRLAATPAIRAIGHDHAVRTVAKIATVAIASREITNPVNRVAPLPNSVGKETALSVQRLANVPPCPAEVAERSAIIGEERPYAEAAALACHGLASWKALAEAHRVEIGVVLERLPPPSGWDGEALLRLTRSFLASAWFGQAVALGWSMLELFGINPHAPVSRVGEWGLVVTLSLTIDPGAEIESIAEDSAIIRSRSGAQITYPRFMPAMNACELWWKCTEI